MTCLLAGVADAGVVLVSQDRYTREQSEFFDRVSGQTTSSDVTTPANGFAPFIDTTGRAQQNSTVTELALTASGSATGSATSGIAGSGSTSGTSQYSVVFDIADEPMPFQLTTTTSPNPVFLQRSLTGPSSISIPLNGTLDSTLAVGRWTFTMKLAVFGGLFGPNGGGSESYNTSLTFIPEPSAFAGGVILLTFLRRRRADA